MPGLSLDACIPDSRRCVVATIPKPSSPRSDAAAALRSLSGMAALARSSPLVKAVESTPASIPGACARLLPPPRANVVAASAVDRPIQAQVVQPGRRGLSGLAANPTNPACCWHPPYAGANSVNGTASAWTASAPNPVAVATVVPAMPSLEDLAGTPLRKADGSEAERSRRIGNVTKQGWSRDEDELIMEIYAVKGPKWAVIAQSLPGRTDDAVRNRYLRLVRKLPDLSHRESLKKGDMWTAQEDEIISDGVQRYGQKWHIISDMLPGRSANAVRNRFLRCETLRLSMTHPSPASITTSATATLEAAPPSRALVVLPSPPDASRR